MPELKDVSIGGASNEDPQKQIDSVVKQTNEAFRMISNEARTSITKDDSGKQRLLIGYQDSPGFSNGKVGIKLSQVGYDVGSATNDQLIFSTDFNTFKISETGTTSIAARSVTSGSDVTSTSVVTFINQYTNTPAVIAYGSFGINDYFLWSGTRLWSWNVTVGGGVKTVSCIIYSQVANTTSVTFSAEYLNGDGVTQNFGALTIKYYILKETAA